MFVNLLITLVITAIQLLHIYSVPDPFPLFDGSCVVLKTP